MKHTLQHSLTLHQVTAMLAYLPVQVHVNA